MEIRTIPGWTYLLTFSYDLDVYARGDMRMAVDRKTGRVVVNYRATEIGVDKRLISAKIKQAGCSEN